MDLDHLRGLARTYFEEITADNPTPAWPKVLLSSDAQAVSIASVVDRLGLSHANGDRLQIFENIFILETCLSQIPNLEHDSPSPNTAISLPEWVANAILPTEAFTGRPLYSTVEKKQLTPDDVAKTRAAGFEGLKLLSRLRKLSPPLQDEPDIAREQASILARDYVESDNLPAMLTSILQKRIKPLFSRSRSPAITEQGRKAIDPVPSNAAMHGDTEVEAKGWKYHDVYIVTVFQWVLRHLKESSVEANWPLIVPPLLALIDDSSVTYKIRGCNSLLMLLHVCPPALLERTGLGEVLENAVMPCLLYLPSLTEEAESLKLLVAAYPALIHLAITRYPEKKNRGARTKALDRILRNGVINGYAHAGEHTKIAELLVDQIATLVDETGIDFVRHLKYILPLLSANLASPFATAYPPLLQASIKAINAIIANAWPRTCYHKGEVLKGLVICWSRIKEQDEEPRALENIQESIKKAVRLLTAALQRDPNITEDYRILMDSDGRLRDVLVI